MVLVDLDMNPAARASRIFLLQYVALLLTAAIVTALLAIRSMKKNVVDPINALAEAAAGYTSDRADDQNDQDANPTSAFLFHKHLKTKLSV